MTRFARAKGSKSSNEKNPEDSTPWEVMKDQLLQAKKEKDESKNRKEAEKQRIENYENFLKEQKIQKRKATWCDFPETEGNNQSADMPHKKRKKHKKQKADNTENQTTQETNKPDIEQKADNTESQTTQETNKPDIVENDNSNSSKPSPKKKKKSKFIPSGKLEENTANDVDTHVASEINVSKSTEKPNNKKKKKNRPSNNQSNEAMENLDQMSTDVSKSNVENGNFNNTPKKSVQSVKKKKGKRQANGKPVKKKDVNDRSFQLIINGKEIELVKVDGFPVMKKDAERLQELKTNMMQKGIPKSEIQRTMKLERRRAEKALARMKRDVCYNCRKGGHNLSDCPELKSKIPGTEAGEGICFKCGSTEHRQFECKVQRDKEFRFATCFICKEPGHIARQCPDNPKGLYPNGGCCKLCGDVTHLRKDCPTVNEKKVEKSIKLPTFDSGGDVEGIDQLPAGSSEETSKKAKRIKF